MIIEKDDIYKQLIDELIKRPLKVLHVKSDYRFKSFYLINQDDNIEINRLLRDLQDNKMYQFTLDNEQATIIDKFN